MPLPTNTKGRPFSWSISALQDFEGCPARYAAARFYYTSPFQETDAIVWGNRVHKAAELTLKGQAHTDTEAQRIVDPYTTAILASGHPVEAEREIVLDENLKPVKSSKAWFSKKAWLRIKIDYAMYLTNTCSIGDWKTGKIKNDSDQLLLAFAALNAAGCKSEVYEGRFIWVKYRQVSNPVIAAASEIPSIWGGFLPRVERMVKAWREESFPAKPSPLCPWCPVVDCEKRR